jgi:hypothetical protein
MIKDYNKNVFINCPFDQDYEEFFKAIFFTVFKCGFILRCAKEIQGSNRIRIRKIFSLIDQSKYAIHDISRIGLDSTSYLPRFNMPLELGIFIGCNEFGSKRHKEK